MQWLCIFFLQVQHSYKAIDVVIWVCKLTTLLIKQVAWTPIFVSQNSPVVISCWQNFKPQHQHPTNCIWEHLESGPAHMCWPGWWAGDLSTSSLGTNWPQRLGLQISLHCLKYWKNKAHPRKKFQGSCPSMPADKIIYDIVIYIHNTI